MNKRRKSPKTKKKFNEQGAPRISLDLTPSKRCFTFPAPISSVIQTAKAFVDNGQSEREIRELLGDKLPANYKHVPGTILLINQDGNPIFRANDDGTVSGIEAKVFYSGDDSTPTTMSPLNIEIKKP